MALCTEKKILLTGEIQTYSCDLLYCSKKFGILKHIIERCYNIDGLQLNPGDITHALYWTDRPYTLYVWQMDRGKRAYYFNIADSITLHPAEFIWRDLVIDILIDPDGHLHVLDETELPADLGSELQHSIAIAKELILRNHDAVAREADALLVKFASLDS